MLFDFDIEVIIPNLVAPVKRLPKYLAWVTSLAFPIQQAWQNLFVDYKNGSDYLDFDIGTTYSIGDQVIWIDKSVYMATSIDGSFSGIYPSDITYWTRVNDNFIGVDERVKYNSQKLLFEYALNRFFRTTGIYIQNNFVNDSNNFVMDDVSETSSNMPLDSNYQEDYMDDTPTYNTDIYDYTIFFPAADYAALGADAEQIIKSFANIYNTAGMQYNIDTF